MSLAVITGSTGLIGSEAASYFAELGMDVVGIDNDMRKVFFGSEASTEWNRARLEKALGRRYRHHPVDIRDREGVDEIFARHGEAIELVIHAAAQPSHDWAAKQPVTDFDINALGTLNVLEATRAHAPGAVFIFTSTNKVYGDLPNSLPLEELETRWEIDPDHTYANGIREDMSIDRCLHSLFGASKVAADVLVQEYGRYLRNADGLLSRRDPDRAAPRGSRAAWLPGVRDAVRDDRDRVHRVRIQGQAGSRRHPQPRSDPSLPRVLP